MPSVNFTLHTEPSVSPPEFTITCHTQGGPATTVEWGSENDNYLGDKGYNDTSQVIVDTSQNSVYENRLRVRGRENGSYYCIVGNNIQDYFTEADNDIGNGIVVHGMKKSLLGNMMYLLYSCRRAHQPHRCHIWVQQYTCQY